MKRHYLLSSMAIASVLALGAPQGRADSDVDGMDHSHLNHGVLGEAAHDEMHETHHLTDAASSDVSPASPPPPLEWKSPSR
jgi:hypothetical protein